ncbi:MAG: ABC transporter permease subunit [Phytoplasma sp.]|uniref:ABC transporter permease subunit n=1 Tax=Phytoplasma sp. TaxID=2155 RepID=UPI002B401D02|nr:ABC transporter permease subunit [Phytoplasma sp.]WRH06680.1 MAG: ABC transporter permease subunit [Phytoplasma sp.]
MINFFSSFYKVLTYRHHQGNYLLLEGLKETIRLNVSSCLFSFVFGFLLGICLYLLKINNKTKSYFIINSFINIIISTPYIILIILIINYVTGPYLKCYYSFKAAFICLSFVLIFIFARNCEQIFLQMNPELYQTAYTLGANKRQFIIYFLLTESRVFLILKLVSLFISALAYSSVLHFVGHYGLSGLIYKYGWGDGVINFRKVGFNQLDFILTYSIVIFLLVQMINIIANWFVNKLDKTR